MPALHRPPPRPRGDEPAGLRGAAHDRPQGARAREDARRRRPQRADHRPLARHRRSGERASQVETLAENARDFGVEYYNELDKRQGIVHIIGPEQGFTLPGTTIVCGDSHTSTHGAFGALAHGIGTSEVEHVLATQTLIQKKAKNMRVTVDGTLPPGVTAKDIILAIIGEIGTAGGTGHVIEYAGEAIRALSMEGRMTVCNMSIEGGARAGMIAPDEKTFAYLKDRPKAPKGAAWDEAVRYWETLRSDDGALFDQEIRLDAAKLPPIVTWGTTPEDVVSITGVVPDPDDDRGREQARLEARALDYMGLKPGTKITDIALDRVFIGSCTNGRIEDLRDVAKVVEGKKVAPHGQRHDRAGLGPREDAGRGRGARPDLRRGRLRLARAGLLDVPCHERRPADAAASAAPRPRTATSRAARASRAAPIWSRPRWRRRRRSRGASSISASGTEATPSSRPKRSDESRAPHPREDGAMGPG